MNTIVEGRPPTLDMDQYQYQDTVLGVLRTKFGAVRHGAKLREEQIPAVRRAIATGRTCVDIGDEFGVSASTIHLIAKGRTWRHVGGATWGVAA